MQPPLALALSWVLIATTMALLWLRQRSTRNAGVVDLAWTASVGALGLVAALTGSGWTGRRLLVAILAGSWALRLTVHLARRVTSEPEDGRYRALRERFGAGTDRFLFWFFQAQALLAVLLGSTFFVLCAAETEGWRATDMAAVSLWVLALAGESLADRQLARWRAQPANRGKTCRAGLWRFSRHPNYFFEWLHWLAYPLLGLGLPYGAALWLAPALMLYLVRSVTGVPPTEEQALRSRGEDYRAYQRTTNAFFPGPPRALSAPLPPHTS
jgi:steroid 5-alpha reductase family enzyme